MSGEKFWKKSWDKGLEDLDPSLWEKSYTDAIRPAFEKFPDKTALAFMGVEITFSELDRYSNRFAGMLLDEGIKKGDVVGINLPNIPEYVIAWLGILKAGCVVSGVSPLLSAEEMEFQLKDSRAKGLVTLDAIFAARFKGIAANLPDLKVVAFTSVGGFLPAIKRTLGKMLGKIPKGKVTPIEGKNIYNFTDIIKNTEYSSEDPGISLTADDIAYLQYTGGTTGTPKGAMLTHRNALSDCLIVQKWVGWEFGKETMLSGFPFFHIAGIFVNANCIYLGAIQVLIPNPRDTAHICAELKKYRPTAMANVPSLYQLLMADPEFKKLDHSTLRDCICAAAPFPEESQRDLEKIIGEGKVLETYGMTETSPLTVFNPGKGVKKLGTIGLPLLNTDMKLLDTSTGEQVGIGKPGEICIKGPQVMVGYYNNPEETDIAIDSEGYMHTGDVAIQDEDGYLRIVDRTKDMINVSGFKVFSKRVEEIMTAHPAIEMIATIGVMNPDKSGSEMVKAYVTILPNYEYGGDKEKLIKNIMEFAKEKLTPYETPKFIEILDELPLTAVGKVDKKQLRKMQ